MTRQRDLGPALALAGGGIALAAAVAGFLVVGGPGDARDKRLDVAISDHIQNIGTMASCAFAINGTIPDSTDELERIVEQVWGDRTDIMDCSNRDFPQSSETKVEYLRIDANRLRLCATFRRPAAQQELNRLSAFFPALRAARPAGRQCYELDMSVVPRAPPRPAQQ